MNIPQIDTVRDRIKIVETEGVRKIHHEIVRKARRNKVFEEGTIDGTKLFGSYKKSSKSVVPRPQETENLLFS